MIWLPTMDIGSNSKGPQPLKHMIRDSIPNSCVDKKDRLREENPSYVPK